MKFFMEFATASLNKYGEELCGDKVEFLSEADTFIAVLSDGLGSGVKANILSTLTSKIAMTMLKEGLSIEEVVDTIIHTLPICSVRKLAYSTFSMIQVNQEGVAYIVEFDNPSVFFIRGGKIWQNPKQEKWINERHIYESHFFLEEKDTLVFVSDGVIHAGAGQVLNLGWSWNEVALYLQNLPIEQLSSKKITSSLLGVCEDLYIGHPGDDTTVATIKAIRPRTAVLFSGPPSDREKDEAVVEKLLHMAGKKIVCGGTAANIVSRITGREVQTSFEISDPRIPPIGHIQGVDLVTEGVLTLQGAVELLEKVRDSTDVSFLEATDGAALLARMLFEECTHIHMLVGRAINPAHQNPDFPQALSIKLNILYKLEKVLVELGKIVQIEII
ncbi:MAG: serine/threonine-protein phosphatase [Cellulosilyticum sp.]|nr:serine/threonine-protein phosphatase [Cellulosilyticum sp.]